MRGNAWHTTLSFSSLCKCFSGMIVRTNIYSLSHRCTTLDRATQEARMKQILGQVKDAWASDDLTNSISSFQSFCGLLGMERLPDFLSENNFQAVQDWSEQPLPSDGQALQATILDRSNVSSTSISPLYLLTIAALTPTTYQNITCGLDREAGRAHPGLRDRNGVVGGCYSCHLTQHPPACQVQYRILTS
jgi:hypothetical protein